MCTSSCHTFARLTICGIVVDDLEEVIAVRQKQMNAVFELVQSHIPRIALHELLRQIPWCPFCSPDQAGTSFNNSWKRRGVRMQDANGGWVNGLMVHIAVNHPDVMADLHSGIAPKAILDSSFQHHNPEVHTAMLDLLTDIHSFTIIPQQSDDGDDETAGDTGTPLESAPRDALCRSQNSDRLGDPEQWEDVDSSEGDDIPTDVHDSDLVAVLMDAWDWADDMVDL